MITWFELVVSPLKPRWPSMGAAPFWQLLQRPVVQPGGALRKGAYNQVASLEPSLVPGYPLAGLPWKLFLIFFKLLIQRAERATLGLKIYRRCSAQWTKGTDNLCRNKDFLCPVYLGMSCTGCEIQRVSWEFIVSQAQTKMTWKNFLSWHRPSRESFFNFFFFT